MQKNPMNRSQMLGEMPISKLVPKISVPIMISMLVQALYNVVDSVFVARYDADALTAVSLAYPIQMLMIALAVGMGVGINSLISRRLGEKNHQQAISAAWNGFLIEFAGFAIFCIIGVFFAPALLNLLTNECLQNADKIRSLGATYLSIVCTYSVGLFMSILFERMLQSTGNTVASMTTQLVGALVNIVLDPIMINGMQMGVQGAAIATVIGQCTGMVVGFILNQTRNKELRLHLRDFRFDWNIMKRIFEVGLPSTVTQSISSVMTIGMNSILSGFAVEGNVAVNVLNIYFKLQSFVFMPVFGLGNGLVAIIGYNYGARLKERVYETIRFALKLAVSIMLVGTLIFWALPNQLMGLFEASDQAAATEETVVTAEVVEAEAETEIAASEEETLQQSRTMQEIGTIALRIISLHFMIAAVGITLTNVFQSIGKGVFSLIVSLSRQLLVLLPVAWILARISLDSVWWAFLIAEIVSFIISVSLYRKCKKKYIDVLA